ncbi:mechanosensitive ion channel domain-containing protein [Brevundimonas sp.]|uniref:mechanosensitive ion channel family protein n=1 Tax=Brevundimonas sp. TaxID=1871086 RepID=UPI0028A0F8CB|nr:mechanosensitive ion channel domain-containing protein [Brevundimonas sp.]
MSIQPPATDTLSSTVQALDGRLSTDAVVIAKAIDMLGDFAVNLTVAAIIFVVTLIAAKWASSATRKILSRTRSVQRDPTVLGFLVQIVRVIVILIGMIAVLQRLGVQTTSIIAVLGGASLAVGLALQGTLSNVAAGVMLLILRPYRVGDVIDLNGVVGSVQKLTLFTTEMSNGNNNKIIVPNSKVLADVIINLSGQRTRRVEVKFTVGYGEDLNRVRQVLEDCAKAHFRVLKDPEVWTGVTALLDSSVQVTLHCWVRSEDHFQTTADLTQSGKEALDKAEIEIPFPHQVSLNYGQVGVLRTDSETAAPQKD